MIKIIINGETFNAEAYDCHPATVNIGDKVQTQDGKTHISNQMIKQHIKASFANSSRAETQRLLNAVYSSVYLQVTFLNVLTDKTETTLFTLQNNPSIPIIIWKANLQYYKGTEIELLEKGGKFIC